MTQANWLAERTIRELADAMTARGVDQLEHLRGRALAERARDD